jgi:hypothetical protein
MKETERGIPFRSLPSARVGVMHVPLSDGMVLLLTAAMHHVKLQLVGHPLQERGEERKREGRVHLKTIQTTAKGRCARERG